MAVKCKINKETDEVENRLISKFGIPVQAFIEIGQEVLQFRSWATKFAPDTAPGFYSWARGVEYSRIRLQEFGYNKYVNKGVCGVISSDGHTKIIFQNVDSACTQRKPKPISEKGTVSEKEFAKQTDFFDILDANKQSADSFKLSSWYLCCSYDEVNNTFSMELSMPIGVHKKTFSDFVERNFITNGNDFPEIVIERQNFDGEIVEITPEIKVKNN